MGLHCIVRDYFGVDGLPPIYSTDQFERRSRVPRAVFLRIFNALKDRPFWKQRINATGQLQAHPLRKVVGAFRVLAYGECPDRGDEYVRLLRTKIGKATKLLIEYVVDELRPAYLRPPNQNEVEQILARNVLRGMPGCLGSLDCSHWEWAGCPKGRAGTFQDGNGKRVIVLEAICERTCGFTMFFSGAPRSLNGFNVLY